MFSEHDNYCIVGFGGANTGTLETEKDRRDTPTFLDLCCGSGAIAVSLLRDNGSLRGYAVDQSEEAVALTNESARR